MNVSVIPSPSGHPIRRAAARIDASLETSGDDLSGADVVLTPRLRVAGFCASHLLPFAGQIHAAQFPLGRGQIFSASTLQRALRELCSQPRHPTQVAEALATHLELLRGPVSVLLEAELRHACGSCGVMDAESGESYSSVARGAFRFRPDLAASVGRFMHQIDRQSASGSGGLIDAP